MSTIPLHLLPGKASKRVLQNMEIYDQLAYSLCSESAKKSIKSLELTAEEVNICISDEICFDFCFKNTIVFRSYMEYDDHFPNEEFRISDSIDVSALENSEEVTEWIIKFQKFGIKGWLHHFCEVLHHSRIDELDIYDEYITDDFIKPVQKVIEGLRLVYFGLGRPLTPEFIRKALESFQNYEELYIDRVPFDSLEVHIMNKVLTQNLNSLSISEAKRLKIDQVLISNSKKIELSNSLFTEKDYNRFLKLWIRGSNPRLRYLITGGQPHHGSVSLDENIVLRRIRHNQIPLDSQEVYREKVNENYTKETKLAGGYRIWRFDGTTAVVLVKERDFGFIVDI